MVGAPPRQPYTLYQRRPRESTRAHTRKKWAKAIKWDQPLDALSDGCFEFSEFVLGVLSYWFLD